MTPMLPRRIRDLALALGADPDNRSGSVNLYQTGRMKLGLTSRFWLPFAAYQTISLGTCGFNWTARFQPLGWLSVTDALEDGAGRLDVTAMRVFPFVRSCASRELTRGELMRYLAELSLAPDAMLHNPHLRWRVDNADSFTVGAGHGTDAAEVTMTLGTDGRVASVFAPDRARSIKPPFLRTPWCGHFDNYRKVQGRWIPHTAQVAWVVDGVTLPYWRGALTEWSMIPT